MKYKQSARSPGELFQIKNLRAMRGQRLDSTKSCTPELGQNLLSELENFNYQNNIIGKQENNDVIIKTDKSWKKAHLHQS